MTTKTNLVVMTFILTFALIATVTLAFAQGEDTGMTTDNSTMMNATLAFAQGESEGDTGMTEGFGNDTGITDGQTNGEADIGNDGGE